MSENIMKIIYAVAGLCFLCNMVAGLFMKLLADRKRDPGTIVRAMKWIFASDKFLTVPSLLIFILLNRKQNGGKFLFSEFAEVALLVPVTLAYGLLFFLFIVHPARRRILHLAIKACSSGELNRAEYQRQSTRWLLFGLMELLPFVQC